MIGIDIIKYIHAMTPIDRILFTSLHMFMYDRRTTII